jgi:hypothetical protein
VEKDGHKPSSNDTKETNKLTFVGKFFVFILDLTNLRTRTKQDGKETLTLSLFTDHKNITQHFLIFWVFVEKMEFLPFLNLENWKLEISRQKGEKLFESDKCVRSKIYESEVSPIIDLAVVVVLKDLHITHRASLSDFSFHLLKRERREKTCLSLHAYTDVT